MIPLKLQHIVEFISETEYNSFTQICDNQLKFIFVGKKFCNLLNLDYNDIVNKNLRMIKSPLSVLSDEYLALHMELLNGIKDKIEYITFMKHKQRIFIAQNTVNSIKDHGVILGVLIRTEMLDKIDNLPNLKDCIANLNHTNYKIISRDDHIYTSTEIEEFTEVLLFLIALGKYDKEIAQFCSMVFKKEYTAFSISKFITRKLFTRFNVTSRNKLISKILFENVLNKIPNIIFNNLDYYSMLIV